MKDHPDHHRHHRRLHCPPSRSASSGKNVCSDRRSGLRCRSVLVLGFGPSTSWLYGAVRLIRSGDRYAYYG